MRVAHILDVDFGHVCMRGKENLTVLILYILNLLAVPQVGDIMVMLNIMQTI